VFFKGYALRRQNIVYLSASQQAVTETMKKVISNREDPCWKHELSKYFLHYHPDNCDIKEAFNSNFGLPKRHGESFGFYEFLKGEWCKCISFSSPYDPFAVCAYVRIMIEKCAYTKLKTTAHQDEFIQECNGTGKKLEFVELLGIAVPEACFLLGVVYNDALHRRDAIDQSSIIAIKLRNLGLQSIMKKAIDW
jgi:hypothetical protein